MSRRAVFLDRDGVLVKDLGITTTFSREDVMPDAADAVAEFTNAGFLNVVVTNQTVVARGLLTMDDVEEIHERMMDVLSLRGGVIDAIYVCPHHPEATLPQFRRVCECRKPASGMLIQAASDLDIELDRSFLIGDRLSDVVAGWRVGVHTVLLESGRQHDGPIRSQYWPAKVPDPDFRCPTLSEAVGHILGSTG